jgi:hypothetical protein
MKPGPVLLSPLLALPIALGARAEPLQPAQPAQQLGEAWPGAEGPLANAGFLPTAAEAEALFARGDEALAGGRPDAEVFDAWHAALAASQPGDSVAPRPVGELAGATSPWPDPDRTADRRTEGVERSLLRRLAALDGERRATWTARFGALAAEELAQAGSRPLALAGVERLHPATPAAARAALVLADLALEEGRLELARLWLARSGEHAALAGVADDLEAARAARGRACAELEPASESPTPAWATASDLAPRGFVALPGMAGRSAPRPGEPLPGSGVQPGAAFFDDGTAIVQSAERIHFVDLERLAVAGELVLPKLLERAHWIAGEPEVRASEPPGWPLLPLAHGDLLVCVQGRTVGRARNALVCLDVDPPGPEGPRRAALRWALRGNELFAGGGSRASGLELDGAEFQPGLAVLGSQLFAQVRQARGDASASTRARTLVTEDPVPSWVVAIDLATGEVRWQRFVAQGLASRGDTRYGMSLPAVSAAQPLATVAGLVFAGTHLGSAALLEPDGRLLYTIKNRRRGDQQPGWSGATPPTSTAGEVPVVLWAPADGDHLYWLRADASALVRGPLLHPPRAIDEAEVLVGGDAGSAVVLARTGREQHAALWLAASGARHGAPYLGPGEHVTGHGLCSASRALFATERGLVLLDRTRELFLLDYAALSPPSALEPGLAAPRRGPAADRASAAPPGRAPAGPSAGPSAGPGGPAGAGGSLAAARDTVLVVGPAGVWVFTAR